MKTLKMFAPMMDRKKFEEGGFFLANSYDELGNPVYTEFQKKRIKEVEREFKKIDGYKKFDFDVNLSTEQTAAEMCDIITETLIPLIDLPDEFVVANLTIDFYDKISRTHHKHKDSIIVGTKFVPLATDRSHTKAEYNYMIKSYVNELTFKYATRISADEIMDMLKLEVE